MIDRRRILFVDDDEMVRDFMTVRLSRRGYSVSAVDGGLNALEIIKQQKFDLVLMDMMMPGLSGYETLLRLRKNCSMLELPVIMVTSVDQEETIINSLQAGTNDYLIKPLNFEIALARITSQLSLKFLSSLKGEFLGFASHDLKKNLMLMLDIAHSLQKEVVPGKVIEKQASEDLGLLIETGEDMDNVMQSFLEFESMRSGQLELDMAQINLNDVISKSMHTNETYANKKNVKLIQKIDENLPVIKADKLRLGIVLENLTGNATKFSSEDTTTVVRSRTDGINVYAEVKDSGPDLSNDDMEKLFVKHARLSNKPTGNETSTGLGLAICKQLISLHGGDIGARKNSKMGTTFWFSLPIEKNRQNAI